MVVFWVFLDISIFFRYVYNVREAFEFMVSNLQNYFDNYTDSLVRCLDVELEK